MNWRIAAVAGVVCVVWVVGGCGWGGIGDGPAPASDAGVQGPAGPVGAQGPPGASGPQGAAGPAGEQGPMGERGPSGEQGPLGPQGPRGDQGPIGPTGDRGSQGEQGLQGPAGKDGDDGLSAPEIEALIHSLLTDWAETITPNDLAEALHSELLRYGTHRFGWFRFDADGYTFEPTRFAQPGVTNWYSFEMDYPLPLTKAYLSDNFTVATVDPDPEYRDTNRRLEYGGTTNTGHVFLATDQGVSDGGAVLYLADTKMYYVARQNFGLNTAWRDDWRIRFEVIGYPPPVPSGE